MAQVSKYPISKLVEKRMYEIFQSVISSLKHSSDIDEFINDLLSPIEKIMLAKRLSIAVLLEKGYSYEDISKILRVTPPTIANVSISLKYRGNGYKKAVQKILKDEKMNNFLEKLQDLVVESIPPIRGKGTDWSYLKIEYEKEKRKRRKAF